MKMENEQKEEKKKTEILETKRFSWQVPRCCLEGWDSCPHTVKRANQKPKEQNIGL